MIGMRTISTKWFAMDIGPSLSLSILGLTEYQHGTILAAEYRYLIDNLPRLASRLGNDGHRGHSTHPGHPGHLPILWCQTVPLWMLSASTTYCGCGLLNALTSRYV
jgi:hypothetical protein